MNIQEELKKLIETLLIILIMMVLNFLWKKKILARLRYKIIFVFNVFGCESKLVFPVYISDQTFKSSTDLLLLINNDQFHYVYIKDFNAFMFHKTKNKIKKWFCKSCL